MRLLLSSVRRLSLALTAITMTAAAGAAAETPPTISAALFDKSHISELSAGDKLIYNFKRNGSEPKLIGPNFENVIELDVDEVTGDGKRTVTIQIFRGELQRDPRKITGLTGNPVLVFFLDRAVSGFSLLAGGNQAYHKNRFRVAMRTEGGLAPVKFEYNGKQVEGYRLAIRPFTGDRKNLDKMKGYENAQFDFLMSDDVPGYFAAFSSHYSSPKPGSPSLEETIVLEGVKVPEGGVKPSGGTQ